MSGSLLLQQVLNGLMTGSLYALVAIGITIIFGLTGIANFAQGQFLLGGAYIASVVGVATWPNLGLALAAGTAGMAAVGVLTYFGLFERTIRKPINGFVVSLGLLLVGEGVLEYFFDVNPKSLSTPLTSIFNVGSLYVVQMRALVFIVSILLIAGLWLFLRTSHQGTALRACSADRETAMLMGIRTHRLYAFTFAIGCGLAGAGGVLYACSFPFSPFVGQPLVVKAFVIALSGGLGNVVGAALVSFILGVAEAVLVGGGYGAFTQVVAFALVLTVLLLRPQGLFGGVVGSAVA